MGKRKRKLTKAEKTARRRRQQEFTYNFVKGKKKRVKREPTIDGLPVDEFIQRNADPIWLFQNERFPELYEWEQRRDGILPESETGPLPAESAGNVFSEEEWEKKDWEVDDRLLVDMDEKDLLEYYDGPDLPF